MTRLTAHLIRGEGKIRPRLRPLIPASYLSVRSFNPCRLGACAEGVATLTIVVMETEAAIR